VGPGLYTGAKTRIRKPGIYESVGATNKKSPLLNVDRYSRKDRVALKMRVEISYTIIKAGYRFHNN